MSNIGLFLPQPRQVDRTLILDYAETADNAGFDSIWIGESWGRNSVVLATEIIKRTTHADVGSGIFNTYSRTPTLLSKTAVTLAEISDERFRLGLGPSGPNIIEGLHGVSFDSPLARMREYVEIIRMFNAGEIVDYSGQFYSPNDYRLSPSPDVAVPIYLASIGEQSIELTGEIADGWLPLLIPLDALPREIERLRVAAENSSRSIDDINIAPYVITCVSESDSGLCREHVKREIARYIGVMGSYFHQTVSRLGYPDEADAIRAAWEDDNQRKAANAVTDEILSVLSIHGTPEEASAKLAEYRDIGVNEPIAFVPPRVPESLFLDTIRGLSV